MIGVRGAEVLQAQRIEDGERVAEEERRRGVLVPLVRVREIGEFFVTYHRLQGRRFRVLKVRGPKHARKLLHQSLKAA